MMISNKALESIKTSLKFVFNDRHLTITRTILRKLNCYPSRNPCATKKLKTYTAGSQVLVIKALLKIQPGASIIGDTLIEQPRSRYSNAPINVLPHYYEHGQKWGVGGESTSNCAPGGGVFDATRARSGCFGVLYWGISGEFDIKSSPR